MTSDESSSPALETLVSESRFLSRVAQELDVKADALEVRERGGLLPKEFNGDRCPDLRPDLEPNATVEFYLGVEKPEPDKNKVFKTTAAAVVAAARAPLEPGTYNRSPDLIKNDEVLLPVLMRDSKNAAKLVLAKVTVDEWLNLSQKAGEWLEAHPQFFPEDGENPSRPAPVESKFQRVVQQIENCPNIRGELKIDPNSVAEAGNQLGSQTAQLLVDQIALSFEQARFQTSLDPRGKGLTSGERHEDYLERLAQDAGINFDQYAQTYLSRAVVGLAGLSYNYLERNGLVSDPAEAGRLKQTIVESLEPQSLREEKSLFRAAMALYRESRGEDRRSDGALFNQILKGYLKNLASKFGSGINR